VICAGLGPQELMLEEVRRFHYRRSRGRPPDGMPGRSRQRSRRTAGSCGPGAALQRQVHSVGIDCWGVDYGLLDGAGRLLEDPVCYRDARTDGMMDAAFERVPRAEMFARTGIQFMQLNTVFQLFAHVREGLSGDAKRLLLVPDLVGAMLSGRAVTEFSIGTTTQMFNASTGTWDDEMLGRLGIPGTCSATWSPGTSLGPPPEAAETG
jgi:sugar (pentulose or hexulose) kinase